MLSQLASHLVQTGNNVTIITLKTEHGWDKEFASSGAEILHLADSNKTVLGKIYEIYQILRVKRPDIVSSWLYKSDFVSSLACLIYRKSKLVWNVRHAGLDRDSTSFKTRALVTCLGYLSFIPDKILTCSETAILTHKKKRYQKSKMHLIDNGVDINKYFPSNSGNKNTKSKFGDDENTFIIGIVGRFSKTKNHKLFVEIAEKLLTNNCNIKFVMIGKYLDWQNEVLNKLIYDKKIRKHFILMGEQNNIHTLLPELDLFLLTSNGEAFPNVLIEAMACGVPCISTNVGDCRRILGDIGHVVNNHDVNAFVSEIERYMLLSEEEQRVHRKSVRAWVETNFEISRKLSEHEAFLKSQVIVERKVN
jgi:glycosyltransferase involved in cell wall biosynthesis